MAVSHRGALFLACTLLLVPGILAETLLQLNGETSYIETVGYDKARSGVFSAGIWLWPEHVSTEHETVFSFATNNLKYSMSVGWVNGAFYYTDAVKTTPVVSTATFAAKQWHYLVLVLDKTDKSVFFDADSTETASRHGILYVDGTAAVEFDTRLPDLHDCSITVGMEYKQYEKQRFFTGLVDEMRIYNKPLTPEQVTTLPFTKPATAAELTTVNVQYYTAYNDISPADIHDDVVVTHDVMNTAKKGPTTKIHYCDKITVSVMPYDALAVSTIFKPTIFRDTLYSPDSLTGPLKGATLTITGVNFANSPFLKVTLDDEPITFTYVDTTSVLIHMPLKTMSLETTHIDVTVVLSNGGANSHSFPYTYQYVVGEDWNDQLMTYYKFDGDLVNAAKRPQYDFLKGEVDSDHMTGSIPKGYGKGGPHFAPNKQGYKDQALAFTRGERVEVPPNLGSSAAWTFCAWLYAEDTARTVYYERDHHKTTVSNLIQIDANGVLYLDGQAGATLIFDAWQFVCVVKDTTVSFYTGGELKATASPVSVTASMSKGLIGTNFTGTIDDVWFFGRALDGYQVMKMYANEEYAVELDGTAGSGYLYMGNAQTGFDSNKYRGDSSFTIELYVKPYTLTGTQPLFYQPSHAPSTLTETATVESYDGTYIALEDGKVTFFVLVDSEAGGGTFARTLPTTTKYQVVNENEWALVSCTYTPTHATISVNGVTMLVNTGNSLADCGDAYCLKNTFTDTYTLEASHRAGYIGYGKQHNVYEGIFKGLIGEVRVWNQALTEEETINYFNCPPVPNDTPKLYAYFKLDDNAGSLFYSGLDPSLFMIYAAHDEKVSYWVESNYTQGPLQQTDATFYPLSPVAGFGTVGTGVDSVAQFTFQARDSCGRVRKFEHQPMQVVMAGPLDKHHDVWYADIAPNGDGTYTGEYQSTTCGFYALRVESTDVPLGDPATVYGGSYDQYMAKGSPFKIYLEPGETDAALSYAYDGPDLLGNDDLASATVGVPASFIVQTVDKFGCKRTTGGDDFDVYMTGRYNVEGSYVDHKDGTYTVTYVPMIAGLTQMHMTLDGVDVATNGPPDPKDSCGVSLGTDYDGSPWLIDVVPGYGSLLFDGNNYVEIPSEDHLNPGMDFTLEAFVMPMPPYNSGRIVSKESSYSGHGYWIGMKDMKITTGLYVGSDNYREITTDAELPGDAWTHISVTYSGNKLCVYANGEKVECDSYDTKLDFKENTQKVVIGKGFTGMIDEVRLARYPKSQASITAEMMCPVGNETVAMYYMFNDGAGEHLFDYSSYGTHGTLKGSPPPSWSSVQAPYAVNTVDFALSSLSGDGLSMATVGVTASYTMDLKDGCGFDYVITDGTPTEILLENIALTNTEHDAKSYPVVTMDYVGPLDNFHTPNIVLTGQVLTTYTAEVCGDAHLHISVDGSSPTGSPFPVLISAAPETSSMKTFATFPAVTAVAGLATEFTITALDKFGCRRTTGGDAFHVMLTRTSVYEKEAMQGPDLVSSKLPTVDHGDGSYTVYYTAPAAGSYVIDIGYDEATGSGIQAISNSPYMFNATAAPWRNFLLYGSTPAARYDPTTLVYNNEMYVFNGWAADKTAVEDVWKYSLADSNTWHYRTKVTIGSLAASHEVMIEVDTASLIAAGKMKADCSDTLFLLTSATSASAAIGYWMDVGTCDTAATGYWLVAPAFPTTELYMYYGNVYAASTAAPASSIFVSYDDFEGASPFDDGWSMAETCSLPAGDASSFTTDAFSSATGTKSLMVDASTKAGGSIHKALATPLSSYKLKAYFYDTDAVFSSHWISPNFDDCTEHPNDKLQLPAALGLGVMTCTTEEYMAMLYPWSNAQVPRTAGWKMLDIVCDGTNTHYYVDGALISTKMASTITKVFIRGGGPSKDGQVFDSNAAWDSVYVANYNPAVTVTEAAEEPIVLTAKDWAVVSTHGSAPPARNTESSVMYDHKLYMIGGYGGSSADELVWFYDFPTSKWHSVTPWGSARLPAREDHTLCVHGDVVYVFGGRSGSDSFGDLWAYDVSDNAWSLVDAGTGPSARFSHSATVYKDTMYVYGGFAGKEASYELWGYNLVSGGWTDLTPVFGPSARFSHTIAVQGDSMFVYGGATIGSVLDDTWRYDFDYNVWSKVVPYSTLGASSARSELGAVVDSNTMYVFGGHGTNSYYNDFWSLAVY